MKVAVLASPFSGDLPVMDECLDRIHSQRAITQLWHMDTGPSSKRAQAWATRHGVSVRTFVFGDNGMTMQAQARRAAIEAHPEYVLRLPCGGTAAAIADFLETAGAPVWKVP